MVGRHARAAALLLWRCLCIDTTADATTLYLLLAPCPCTHSTASTLRPTPLRPTPPRPCPLPQVMLKQDNGQYACIAEDSARYNLGDVKEEMMAAMALNTEEEGSVAAFLRRGYKTSTWWEDAAGTEASDNWRT